MPKDEVQFYLRPRDKFDLHPWTRFNDSVIQEPYGISPERSPPASLSAEISQIVGKLRLHFSVKFAPDRVTINNIMDGYTRFNPHLGREYVVTLKMTVGNQEKAMYRKYHLIRELDPRLSIIDQHIAPSSTVVNVILPLDRVDATFSDFLLSYGHIGLQHRHKLHLVIIIFSADQAILVERVLRHFSANTSPVSASVVTAKGAFDHLKALGIGMESLRDENSLAFLADVNLRFDPGFFWRCRSNTELGKRVYFPSAFWLYKMSYSEYSSGRVPPILPWIGKWWTHHLWMMCIYKKDYTVAVDYQKRDFSVEIFEAIARGHVDIMQAPDPGLFRIWTNKNCKDLNWKRKTICLELKRARYFEQPEMADYLGELQNTKGNVLKQ